MTKKQLNKLLIAQSEGKTVQTLMVNGEWRDVFVSELDLRCNAAFYRIKPDERFVYKYDDKFVIMDVKIPLIKDSSLFEGSLEECNKWIDEQVKEPACPRDDVLMAEEIEGNYTIEQNCGENRTIKRQEI